MAQASTTVKGEKEIRQPISDLPFEISDNREKAHWLKFLVYGEYGVGKTFLLSTAAAISAMRDVLMIDAEAGDLTLVMDKDKYKFNTIDSIRVSDFKAFARVYDFLKLHCQLRDKTDKESQQRLAKLESKFKGGAKITKPKHYNTVIIDSFSEVESQCMYQLLGITDSTRIDEEVATAEWPEYKRNFNMILRTARKFRDLPINLLMSCSRQYAQDEQKKMIYSPGLTGKLSSQVQGFADMVGYLVSGSADEDGQATRRLYVSPNSRYAAKNRFSAFKGAHFDNPTIGSIVKAVGLF